MRISNIQIHLGSLKEIMDQQSAVSDVQLQISTGKRIRTLSDDPIGATHALILKQDLNNIDTYINNGEIAKTILENQDSIYNGLTQNIQRIRELTVQAGSGSLAASERMMIANEISIRRDELLSLANSKDSEGGYIFSGFKVGEEAVITNNLGNYIYNGDDGERIFRIASSMQIPITETAKNIFFKIPNENMNITVTNGESIVNSNTNILRNSGSLPIVTSHQLSINGFSVPAPVSDNISTSDSLASSISIANAINSGYSDHGVRATVNPTVLNLGIFTPAAVLAGDFTINNIVISDALGSEQSLIDAINLKTDQTGVIATQPGGAGSAFILTSENGANIQVQTTGVATADFANFSLTTGVKNQVQQGTYTLRSESLFEIGGTSPVNANLSSGIYNPSINLGSGIALSEVVSTIDNIDTKYAIIFGAGGLTYSIYNTMYPNTPLTEYSNINYIPGEDIIFNGIQVNITGAPSNGDRFLIEVEKPESQDIFTTIDNIIYALKNYNSNSSRLSYEIGIGVSNLSNSEKNILNLRARLGANLNAIESQRDMQEQFKLITQEVLSKLEDLDYIKAISDLSQATFMLEAAQQSFVKIQKLSIFNYL